MRNKCKMFAVTPKGRLVKPKRRWEDDTRMRIRASGCELYAFSSEWGQVIDTI